MGVYIVFQNSIIKNTRKKKEDPYCRPGAATKGMVRLVQAW